MDDLAGPSFLDYVTGAHSSMTSTLEVNNGGLDGTIKQETFDSTVWIQGFSDQGFLQHNTFQSTKTNFLQSTNFQPPMGLESLISEPQISNTPPIVEHGFDPLELILNNPPAETIQPPETVPATVHSIIPSGVKTEPHSDLAIINALEASSTHNATAGLISSGGLTHNALQGQRVSPVEKLEERAVTPAEQIEASPEEVVAVPKEVDPEKDLNLTLTNVVTSFRVRCHLNLRRIAQEGINVIYQKESKKIVMRIRHPKCTAYIWSSGKLICTGANSETAAKKAARKFAKRLQNLGFQVLFSNYKVINVLAVCKMPFHINIVDFAEYHRSKNLSYEPEIHPAVTYRMPEFRVTFKIFSTGSITLTCPVVSRIPEAIKKIYPLIKGFFKLEKPNDLASKRKASEELDEDSSS